MPGRWIDVPIDAKYYSNVSKEVLTRAQAKRENCYVNEAKANVRFPGLELLADISGETGRMYLHDWRGDLVAASGKTGKLYRFSPDGAYEDVTGVPISGGKRVIFAKTDTDLLMAAGKQIIAFDGTQTRVLSDDAPDTSFVGYIDSYVLAIEDFSGRFQHTTAGIYNEWDPLDVFTANGKPDDLTGLLVTEYRELLMTGPESIEQFERLPDGSTPFFRRWSVGEGVSKPYTMIAADNGAWALTDKLEFVRLSGQTSEPRSIDIQREIEELDDLTDAWVGGYPDQPLNLSGQQFIVLQFPNASTGYGTKGVTFVLDYKQNQWFKIFGWDSDKGVPSRWPGWSHWRVSGTGTHYVGGEGKVYKLSRETYANDSVTQRFYIQTAHLSELGEIRIDNARLRVKRGDGSNTAAGLIGVRALRDGDKWTRWRRKSLGKAGDREFYIEFGSMGCGHTWQFEIEVTDAYPVEISKMQAQVTKLGE